MRESICNLDNFKYLNGFRNLGRFALYARALPKASL